MIKQIIGNLLKENVNAFVHQANCMCTMGSGVAREVRELYPEVYEADLKTKRGDRNKVGKFSFAKTKDGKIGYNLYSQFDFGREAVHTNYEAFRTGMVSIKDHLKLNIGPSATIGMPYKIGCVRGGGNWEVVSQILKELFETDTMTLVICEFKDYSDRVKDPRVGNLTKEDVKLLRNKFEEMGMLESVPTWMQEEINRKSNNIWKLTK